MPASAPCSTSRRSCPAAIPRSGPALLAEAGILLVDRIEGAGRIGDGARVRVHDEVVYVDDEPVAMGREVGPELLDDEMDHARIGLGHPAGDASPTTAPSSCGARRTCCCTDRACRPSAPASPAARSWSWPTATTPAPGCAPSAPSSRSGVPSWSASVEVPTSCTGAGLKPDVVVIGAGPDDGELPVGGRTAGRPRRRGARRPRQPTADRPPRAARRPFHPGRDDGHHRGRRRCCSPTPPTPPSSWASGCTPRSTSSSTGSGRAWPAPT